MKTRQVAIENCQIQLHHNPTTAQDLFNHLQPQTIQIPPLLLENGEILIKVLYIALDPSLKPLLAGEKEISIINSTTNDANSTQSSGNITSTDGIISSRTAATPEENSSRSIDTTSHLSSSTLSGGSHYANYFPPPFSKQQEWIETNHPSITTNLDSRRMLNYGVLKAYAVGEVVESKNHLFTKGRNVYGNLGVQQYLVSSGGKDLDDNMVRDITMDSPLSAFLTLSKAGLCAYFGVTELANISENECVFVTGGTGCVGSFVPQIVRASLSDKKVSCCRNFNNNNTTKTSTTSTTAENTCPPDATVATVGGPSSNNKQKVSPSSLCSSIHCLIPERTCRKANSPTISWLFNSLIEEEENALSNNEDVSSEDESGSDPHLQPSFPRSSHEVISRGDYLSTPLHTTSNLRHHHDHHHHLHGAIHHHHHQQHHSPTTSSTNTTITDRSHTNPSTTSSMTTPQIKLYGFCSSDSRKSLMVNKLKYDNAINYSNYLKKIRSEEEVNVEQQRMKDLISGAEPAVNTPICTSCLTPAWSSSSPFSHEYGLSCSPPLPPTLTVPGTDLNTGVIHTTNTNNVGADTCLLKTGQRYDYSNIDRVLLSKAIGEMCPNGIDVVFDTVGGVLLDVCLEHLNMNARIVICGAISNTSSSNYCHGGDQYQTKNEANSSVGGGETFKFEGPHNYVNLILKCARMEGFMVEKFQSKFKQASQTLVRWIQEKKIDSLEENVVECDLKDRAQVINVIGKLFSGEYNGKLIIRVNHHHTSSLDKPSTNP